MQICKEMAMCNTSLLKNKIQKKVFTVMPFPKITFFLSLKKKILDVLQGIIDANEEPLFLRVLIDR